MKTNLYIVIDNSNMCWERANDFKTSGDYFDKSTDCLDKKNILTLKEATKLKNELDTEIASCNNITFKIMPLKF